MEISNDEYKKLKFGVERELRNYPYYLISSEAPGLGDAVRWDKIKSKSIQPGSSIEQSVIKSEHMRLVINAVEYVYDRLDDTSKGIVDLYYFRDNWGIQEILEKVGVDRNRFYKLKASALNKFIIVLGYL